MVPSEYEKLIAKEQMKRRKDLEGLMGKSIFDATSAMSAIVQQRHTAAQAIQPLLASFKQASFPATMFHQSLLDSIKATHVPTFQNIFSGIDRAARESIASTIAGMHQAVEAHWRSTAATMGELANSAARRNALTSLAAISTLSNDTLERTAQAIAEASKVNLSTLGAISGSGALAALDYSKFSPGIEHIRQIQDSYAGQLAAALREVINSGVFTEEVTKPVLELIDSKIESQQKGRITTLGLLSLLLSLISVLISLSSNRIAANQAANSGKTTAIQTQQASEMNGLLRQIIVHIDKLAPEEDQSTYYAVEREVVIRLKPNAKSAKVALLFPNQKVRLVQSNHKWIYVEYFDYLEGVPKYGWATKKYLKRI